MAEVENDMSWLHNLAISETIYDVVCIHNDEFDEEENLHDIQLVLGFRSFMMRVVPSRELVHQVEDFIIDAMEDTTQTIESEYDREIVSRNERERLNGRIRESERKICFLLAEFVKFALETPDPGWIGLEDDLIRLLQSVLNAVLELIGSSPHPKLLEFLKAISTYVWFYVLYDLNGQFDITEFISLLRAIAVTKCFHFGEWHGMSTWNDVLRVFQEKCGIAIERIDVDNYIHQLSLQQWQIWEQEGEESTRQWQQWCHSIQS